MQSALRKAPLFQFWVAGKRVVGVSGDSGRRLFFSRKVMTAHAYIPLYLPLIRLQDLAFDRAYSELNFPSPEVHTDNVSAAESDRSEQHEDPELFSRRLQLLLSNTRITASTLCKRSKYFQNIKIHFI